MVNFAGKYGPNAIVVEIFSCLAKENSIFIALNLGSKREEGALEKHFNTDVVFNRLGNIVARYDKRNLFRTETNIFDTPNLEIVSFETDFGTFGIITCFDAIYEHPFIDLTEARGKRRFQI